ncbi:putative mitochondrial translation system component PET127 [Kluyveromyces marxianus DMKU3-1042]|uniref:Putative mitochondrial translation system component PET127 n=1 Tax=Kluyveromyces marxianus (strain DMKU3-1042 / BCC 29191 / NBRC 104275) TaxID=1003335 RepID=W0TDC8_KLUMD|nr:Pet127 family protein [Kluyveromyces marxianus DMKU3-1042]BAO41068.1 putative mitochondrial translation system component PET127 [Kluyveromyces marxianus DMKU3-1042]
MLRYRYGAVRCASKGRQPNISATDGLKRQETWIKKVITSQSLTRRNDKFSAFTDQLTPVPKEYTGELSKPPTLKHSLTQCLYQPMNIVPLRDNRTSVFNFTPFLESLIDVEDFDFDGISPFIPPSQDPKLAKITENMDKRYFSSTSSMTGLLSHMHFLLSNFRPLNLDQLTRSISPQYPTFTRGARSSCAIIMKRTKNGCDRFSISADKSINKDIILSRLGHCLEMLLTTPEQEFDKRYNKNVRNKAEQKTLSSSTSVDNYHYATIGDFVLRSQLDAYEPNLPGTGVFDLKTRAVAAIRHDLCHVENNDNYTGYELNRRYGSFESFEREFYELVRSTMLKYSLQARIGNMDGIFVAYHNISKMFGFQYIPQQEMNHILHSNVGNAAKRKLKAGADVLRVIYGDEKYVTKHEYETNQYQIAQKVAEAEFNISMQFVSSFFKNIESLLEKDQHARIVIKTTASKRKNTSVMHVLVTPLDEKELETLESMKLSQVLFQQDHKHINEYIIKLNDIHHNMMWKTVGYTVSVDHEFDNRFDETSNRLPYYGSESEKTKEYIRSVLRNHSEDWEHPYFHYPEEVNDWKVKFNITPITDNRELRSLLRKTLGEQLGFLESQTVEKTDDKMLKGPEFVRSQLSKLVHGKGRSLDELHLRKHDDNDISTLQSMLRALGDKKRNQDANKKSASSHSNSPVMWNQNEKPSSKSNNHPKP